MKVHVQSRSGRSLGTYDLDDGATIEALQTAFHSAHPKYHVNRQRFYHTLSSSGAPSTTKRKPPAYLASDALSPDTTVMFKDLGPQISWRTVFIVEYLGPLLIYPLFYMRPSFIYNVPDTTFDIDLDMQHTVQLSALIAWTIHYCKREFETLFIHRFSNATMPYTNIFKNSIYYWGFAAYVAYFINHPLYTPPSPDAVYTGLSMFYFMQVGNFTCHYHLRTLRPPGSKVRKIPYGGLFEYVSCPNYTYEILAWLGFNIMTKTVAGALFMLAGATQMIIWANGKHRRYKKDFDGQDGRPLYPKNRTALVPFIY